MPNEQFRESFVEQLNRLRRMYFKKEISEIISLISFRHATSKNSIISREFIRNRMAALIKIKKIREIVIVLA
jgi:hypothetical protein